MRVVFSCLLLLFVAACSAQMIAPKPQEIAAGDVNFNPDFIKKNKIKKIEMQISDKPDGTVIIDKGECKGYEFEEFGYVTRYYYTLLNPTETEQIKIPPVQRKGKIIHPASTRTAIHYFNDTISISLFYNSSKRITCKRVRNGDYYDAWYYEYNEHGRVHRELHCKETNVSENKKEFQLGVQTILSTETFQYTTLTPTQIKKSCLNDEGREYKKGIINYDAKGNKTSENYEFIVSWMRSEITWQYDTNGKLVKRSYKGNEAGNVSESSIYEYEKNALLITETQFKNNELVKEINYLYDETNTLIKSEVNRNHSNASIDIVKYSYTFY